MSSSQRPHISSEQKKDDKAISSAFRQIGLTGEAIEHLVKSSNSTARELGSIMHDSGYGKMARQLGPIGKLVEVAELKEVYDELREHGHSAAASFIGAGAGFVAGEATYLAGAGLVTAGVLATPEVPPIGVTAVVSGSLLMHESENVAKMTRHHVPIIVDSTLDKFSNLYSSVAQFAQQSYQKFTSTPAYAKKQYSDVESAMLDLGYKEYVKNLYTNFDQNQQLLYSTVARDLFNQQFTFNQDRTLKPIIRSSYSEIKMSVNPSEVKGDIVKIQGKLTREAALLEKKQGGQLDKAMKGQNDKLKTCLNGLVKEANQKAGGASSGFRAPKCDAVKSAQEFCDVFNAASQGASLVARIAGNNRVAQQITQSAMGVSQVVMGIAQIAQNGWAAGPVGMVFGGMNALVACFGSDGGNEGMEALAEQLAIISQQIHALHEDMLLQFSKVFTALGIINTNIIEGFKLLHEDQQKIFINVIKLQKSVAALQDSVNAVGHKIDMLASDLQGYPLEDDRKQLQLALNDIREKSKRPFNRLKLHPQAMSAFKTFNESVVVRKINGEKATSADVAKSLTTKLGSAEANTGLLLNFAKNILGMEIKLPIADPEQWRQCADLLIYMVEKTSEEKKDMAVIGEQDYKDFKHLKEIGENWLGVIEQFKSNPGNQGKLAQLFQRYRSQVNNLISLVEEEINRAEQETKNTLKPKYLGQDDFEKQKKFNYEFKRNYAYLTLTEDASGCKGFHNPPRSLGYDNYGSEWAAHLEARKKDIAERLTQCGRELGDYQAYHAGDSIQYYKNEKKSLIRGIYTPWHSASAFMVSDTKPDTMPLLPLPHSVLGLTPVGVNPPSTRNIPTVFIEAEILGIGTIKHTYQFEKNEFIYKIQFQIKGEEKPIIIAQYNKACTLADYLNPAEAVWHAYMGGTYPANGSYSHLRSGGVSSSNGDYWVNHHCAIPSMATTDGLRKTFEISKETPKVKAAQAIEDKIAKKVKDKKAALRQTMNEKILQNLESLDSRNTLATALLEVDASAKMLIAVLSILFRETYQRPVAIWTRDEIIDFVRHYQNHDVYLPHQLDANLAIFDSVEKILLAQMNLQTEIAYTPVKATLKKLTHFMALYEKYVLKDSVLVAKEKSEENKDAVMYGATQATLLLQSELLNSGHIDAAVHISQLLTSSGLGLFSILPPTASSPAQIAYSKSRLFPAISSSGMPGTAATASSSEQNGWNCFDLATGLGEREKFVNYALANSASPEFRKLLAPEIRLAACLPDEVETALPSIMRTAEVKRIVDNYQRAHELMRPAVAACNDALGYLEGKRLSLEELITFFTDVPNISKYRVAHTAFMKEYDSIYAPTVNAFNDYVNREDIYRQYVREYYGKGGWFVFHNSFSGESHTTSMVDIAALYLKCKIAIYLTTGISDKKMYETASPQVGSTVVEVNWNGYNHFVKRPVQEEKEIQKIEYSKK